MGPAETAIDIGHYELSELPPEDKTDHSLMQTQVEFKREFYKDPFIDPSKKSKASGRRFPFENPTAAATQARGQIACYAGATLYLSFRMHLFTVFIFGRYCRFIRWDRRGAVVTHRFDYTENPEILFYFHHCFAQLTRVQRGFDPTVTKIDQSSKEVVAAIRRFSEHSKDLLHCDGRTDTADSGLELNPLVLKMTVTFDGVERSFIIPSPLFHLGCLLPFSRSTRSSLAYDPAAKGGAPDLLFMKDSWREDSGHTVPEAEIYRLLKVKEVDEHVAEMDIGGNIPELKTRWQETTFCSFTLFPNSDVREYTALQGHRIFLKTIAMDLTVFLNAKWLVTCVADGMQGKSHSL